MARFMRWAGERRGRAFADYDELWRWSVDELEDFWAGIWEFCGVRASQPYERVLGSREMPGARWFEGARAELRREPAAGGAARRGRGGPGRGRRASRCCTPPSCASCDELTWGELRAQVAAAAGGLRALGVGRGDRVVAYMPNIPETLVAFLAVAPASARSGRARRPSSARAA